jgi:hypothetical protein
MPEHPDGADNTTPRRPTGHILCPVCWAPFIPTGRQRYCTDTCRKTAWTRRQPTTQPRTKPTVPQAVQRGDVGIYACPSCRTRYCGKQWCHPCHQPCTHLGLGGLCPHCDQPVTVTDLLDAQQATNNR